MHIGIDTGGTFTDLVLYKGRRVYTHKVPSTPDDFARGIVQGVRELLLKSGHVEASYELSHSTTVATNALLERRGARTALITTAGFRDVLEIGRQARASLYDLHSRKQAPLVRRGQRHEVSERIASDGTVLAPLRPREVDQLLDKLIRQNIESVAICLLFSFRKPDHERRIARSARRRGLNVSVSAELCAEYREYERCSTTVVNAYVAPLMACYIRRLDPLLRRQGARSWRVMQSNGGTMTPRSAGAAAASTLLSGPAAGVSGAMAVARRARKTRAANGPLKLITFDMGGTSTDVSLIDAEPQLTSEGQVAGHPVCLPMLDIHTVGAGGGSIAHIDAGGALKVGPHSAGADPGPACYGRGAEPTVTDANLLLGLIHPARFCDGCIPLDVECARHALLSLARRLDVSPKAAARAVLAIVNANMERALRIITVQRGHDPREFTLMSFGGAGGLHACALADALEIRQVLIPREPGTLSAWGAATSDTVKDYSLTVMLGTVAADEARLHRVMQALGRRAKADLHREAPPTTRRRLVRSCDLRYTGQSFELNVPFTGRLDRTLHQFHEQHARRYGHCDRSAPVEVVTARVRGVCRTPKPAGARLPHRPSSLKSALVDQSDGNSVYDRALLGPGQKLSGPAIILESYATTLVPQAWRARVDDWGNLSLSNRPGRQRRARRRKK